MMSTDFKRPAGRAFDEAQRRIKGRPAVIRTLRLAQFSGRVGGGVDSSTDFWVDQLDVKGNLIGEIALDRKSWNSLKNRWMRCRMTDYE